MIETFEDAADAADEAVPLAAGGTEPRYEAHGLLVWEEAEIEDQIEPLMLAGAANFTRVGGRLGIVPGVWRAPDYTLSDVLDPSLGFTRLKPGANLPTRIACTYTSAARGYEEAELVLWDIPGATTEDGGIPSTRSLSLDFVTSATQAMRIRQIIGLSARRQRKIDCIAPPSAVDLVPGAVVMVDFPSPRSPLNGTYEVVAANPGLDPIGQEGGVACRVPLELLELTADVFAWSTDDEEQVYEPDEYDATRSAVQPPGALSVAYGAEYDLDTGAQAIPRVRFEADPSTSSTVSGYEWQFSADGGAWTSGGSIDAGQTDGEGDVFGFLISQGAGVNHSIRLRAVRENPYQASAWVQIDDVILGLGVTVNSAAPGGAGEADFDIDTPDYSGFAGVQLWRAATDDFGAAAQVGTQAVAYGQNGAVVTFTGLTAGTGYFWLVPYSGTGTTGAEQGSHALTIT